MIIPSRELMPIVRAALERGQHVKMTVNGSSMRPFIYNNDEVEMISLKNSPKLGDILLVECENENYLIHRVVLIDGNGFYLRGDAHQYCDGRYQIQHVAGKVISTIHKEKIRRHDKGFFCLAGLIWLRIYRITPAINFIIHLPRKIARRIFTFIMGTNYRAYREKKRKLNEDNQLYPIKLD